MSSSPHETRFDPPGTLRKPDWIGRIVRLLLGIWLLYLCWTLLRYPETLVRAELPSGENLLVMAIALWLIPPVINIGFGLDWRAWPRYIAVGVIGLSLATLWLLEGTLWSPALGRFVWLVASYTFGHLGVSFVLAAAIATPGCEMRAIPHLWSRMTGRATREHFCPGFLNGLDRWEAERRGAKST